MNIAQKRRSEAALSHAFISRSEAAEHNKDAFFRNTAVAMRAFFVSSSLFTGEASGMLGLSGLLDCSQAVNGHMLSVAASFVFTDSACEYCERTLKQTPTVAIERLMLVNSRWLQLERGCWAKFR